MQSYDILVIVLSVVLALCLITAFIAGIYFVLILKQLKKVSEKATEVVSNVEVASEFFKNTTISGAALKLFSNAASLVSKHSKEKKDNK